MKAIQVRLRPQIDTLIPLPSSLRRFFVLFSSSSSASSNPRVSNSFFDEAEGNSGVYRHTLKFQRPSTVPWRPEFWNSASFIGTVTRPVRPLRTENGVGAYTYLRVRDLNKWIPLRMWDKMAYICFQHLKKNDFIYVSGPLQTYLDPDPEGKTRLRFQVTVKELNYVTGRSGSTSKNNEELQSSEEGALTGLEKYNSRLHLWQVFFSSPYEWWDNRKDKANDKVNKKVPDFKHKDTGEALWLSPNDPPWIKKQIQLLDSKLAERGQGEPIGRRVSKWEYDG